MTYLVSYRNGSGKYGSDQAKAVKLPEPYRPNTPRHANDNAPTPANDNERPGPRDRPGPRARVGANQGVSNAVKAARVLAYTAKGLRLVRVHPALNVALTALDIWNAYGRADQSYQSGDLLRDPVAAGWTSQTVCTSGPTHFQSSGPFSPWPSTFCLANQSVPAASTSYEDIDINHGRMQVYKWHQFFGGTNRYYNQEWLWRSAGFKFRLRQRTWKYSPKPIIFPDPHLLPIKWPLPYPLPLPMALVRERLNDPLGSSRTNGDKLPFSVGSPRKPPPPNVKEKKIRTRSQAVMLALQAAAHGVTEANDVVDAVHKALPKRMRAKAQNIGGKWFGASPQAKAAAVWKNWPSVNIQQAAINLAVNHLGDKVVGRANAKVAKGLKNSPIGRINMGPIFGGAN